MSNYGNRNSKMPDISPKPRQDFSVRDRTVAIMILAALIAIIALAIGAFGVHDTKSVEKALAEIDQEKADQFANFKTKLTELDDREKALNTRETKLNTQETDLKTREEALAVEQDELATEKEEFHARTLRVRDLCYQLFSEIDAEFPIQSVVEDIDLDAEE